MDITTKGFECTEKCEYVDMDSKWFSIVHNMARCVISKNNFDQRMVTRCASHMQFHICGGQHCVITEDGICLYTKHNSATNFKGVATHNFGFPDRTCDADALDSGVKRKATEAFGIMEYESFLHNVLKYTTSENDEIDSHMQSVIAKSYKCMVWNLENLHKTVDCDTWMGSTIQVLRSVKGMDAIPNLKSSSDVKGIVVDLVKGIEPPKQLWWTKKACITKQWKM